MDGNFRQSLCNKAMDPDDTALTEAAAFFVDQSDFKLYVHGTENQPKDVSGSQYHFVQIADSLDE